MIPDFRLHWVGRDHFCVRRQLCSRPSAPDPAVCAENAPNPLVCGACLAKVTQTREIGDCCGSFLEFGSYSANSPINIAAEAGRPAQKCRSVGENTPLSAGAFGAGGISLPLPPWVPPRNRRATAAGRRRTSGKPPAKWTWRTTRGRGVVTRRTGQSFSGIMDRYSIRVAPLSACRSCP